MSEPQAIRAIRAFVDVVLEGDDRSISRLAQALDEIGAEVHRTPPGDPGDNDTKPPRTDYADSCQRISARYPDLGHFLVAEDTLAIESPATMVVGAIDCLADIVADLNEVVWRFEHDGADEAHWYMHMLYEIHWGAHLRQVALYLYALQARESP